MKINMNEQKRLKPLSMYEIRAKHVDTAEKNNTHKELGNIVDELEILNCEK